MATANLIGFETGDSVELFSIIGTGSIQSTTKRTGTYALECNPVGATAGAGRFHGVDTQGRANQLAGVSLATSYCRFYFRYATKAAANDEEIFSPLSTAGSQTMGIRLNSSGNLASYDSAQALQSTGTTVLNANTWYRIEIQMGTGNPSAYVVKIDGVTELSGNMNQGTVNQGGIRLGKGNNRNGNTVDYFFDDVLWSDSGFPGAGQCTVLLPNANGNYQTSTIGAGSGSHYQIVNEIPPNGNTSYLASDLVANDKESEALTNSGTAGITGTVNSVKALSIVIRDGVTNGTFLGLMRSGSTDATTSVNYSSTAAYVGINLLKDTDPNTGAAWVLGNLDSVESGGSEQDTVNKTRMTWTGLMVDYLPSTGTVEEFGYSV